MRCLTTPFGELATYAQAGTLDTRRTPPDQFSVLPGGTQWSRWSAGSIVAEVFAGPYSPKLPPDMAVQGCVAVVWRVRAQANVAGVALSCHLSALPSGAEGGPETGEGLDAQTWSTISPWLSTLPAGSVYDSPRWILANSFRFISSRRGRLPATRIATIHGLQWISPLRRS